MIKPSFLIKFTVKKTSRILNLSKFSRIVQCKFRSATKYFDLNKLLIRPIKPVLEPDHTFLNRRYSFKIANKTQTYLYTK